MHLSLRPYIIISSSAALSLRGHQALHRSMMRNDAHVAQRACLACYLKVNASPAGMHAHQNHEENNQFISEYRNA